MNRDLEHLRLLSIFHYVVAGLAFLFSLFPIIHLVLGLVMLTGRFDSNSVDAPPEALGWIFVGVALFVMMLGFGFAACLALAGRYLAIHRNHTFCMVMAALACMFMPFGTVLGVFTIVVLTRDSVREIFGLPREGA